jgi:hypothetical protein
MEPESFSIEQLNIKNLILNDSINQRRAQEKNKRYRLHSKRRQLICFIVFGRRGSVFDSKTAKG